VARESTQDVRKRRVSLWVVYVVMIGAAFLGWRWLTATETPEAIPYSDLVGRLDRGEVRRIEIGPELVVAEPTPEKGGKRVAAVRPPELEDAELLRLARAHGVEIVGHAEPTAWWQMLLWMAPLVLISAVWIGAMRRMARGSGPLTFGKSQAKIYDQSREERVTFSDVAGVEGAKAELTEVVDMLRDTQRYAALGARIPRGVLLVGPPGTGKTLLAKAVAGEADVPFFSISGSEFVQMFVGVGAARVRDLFEQAMSRAPCIIFIDELDAIGRARGGPRAIATHEEREQTLNQLLVEMDGFDPTRGVVIIGATNQPEVLDHALLRAGRFDRRVLVDRPDLRGREETLRVHTRHMKLAADVDLALIARRTPGMVGADLATLCNEAALAAARRHASDVAMRDFEEAVDRVQLGLEKHAAMTDDEKRRVAYHESGHALCAMSMEHADPVHRVSIIPRTIGALGHTLQLPTEERFLMTRGELHDRLCVMLGGRAAEELRCDDISTGAQSDLERATETARQMVCRFGMSDALGALTYGRSGGPRFLDPTGELEDRNFSEETARAIDAEVRAIMAAAHERARTVLESRLEALDLMVEELLAEETLDADDLERLLGVPSPRRPPEGHHDARPSIP
jgi:cell division protease FtsH